jgi:hypothetical protein
VPQVVGRAKAEVERAVRRQLESPERSNPFARAEFRSRIKRFAIFTPFRLEERDAVAELALTEMAAHYQAAPRTRFTVGWEPSAVGYFSGFYGGTEGKTGLRPLVAAVEECDTLLRQRAPACGSGVLFTAPVRRRPLRPVRRPFWLRCTDVTWVRVKKY